MKRVKMNYRTCKVIPRGKLGRVISMKDTVPAVFMKHRRFEEVVYKTESPNVSLRSEVIRVRVALPDMEYTCYLNKKHLYYMSVYTGECYRAEFKEISC